MNDRRKEYIFTWFIENYSYCWHKIGEELNSPEFTADDLDGTTWNIGLFPRGDADEREGFISIFLNRGKDDGPETFEVNYELSILANSKLNPISLNDRYSFPVEMGWGYGQFAEMDEVLVRRKTDYLPQDRLSVRCRIWKDEGNIQTFAESSAKTRIGIEQISFVYVIEDFCELEPNEKESIRIGYPSKKEIALLSSLYFTDGPCCNGKMIINVTTNDTNRILSKFKISLLDKSGTKIECGEIDNRFDATGKRINNIPLSLTRQDILNRKTDYMSDDKLSFLCQCTFSTGVEYQKIERSFIGKHCSLGNQLHFEDEDNNIYEKKLSACPSALDELKRIYNHLPFTDVQLKTKTKSFPVHKLLLCARSPVFNAMLTTDMKEKNTDLIQVDDIDDEILQQFLQFLYSDNVENFKWESATKLYYAADKYEVVKLKILCSCFLVDNLHTSNASELLLLADTHNDCDLKKVVEDFILKHEEDVFDSDEWRNLMETNPLLVSKTMCQKYMKKF